jgi:moderate conductance mechanosensitive channel
VAYREDLDEVYAVMREVAAGMRADPELGGKIVEDLEIAGVDKWADSAVVIRCRFKVRPLEQWTVRRTYLYRLKKAFDAAGIEIPYPHLTLYAGQDKDGSAPPLRLLQQAATFKVRGAPLAARPSDRRERLDRRVRLRKCLS